MSSRIQDVQKQFWMHRSVRARSDNQLLGDINHNQRLQNARLGWRKRLVNEFELIQRVRFGSPLSTVKPLVGDIRRDCGAPLGGDLERFDAQPVCQPIYRSGGYRNMLPLQLLSFLAHGLNSDVLLPHPADPLTSIGKLRTYTEVWLLSACLSV